jgi:thioredoxin reductase
LKFSKGEESGKRMRKIDVVVVGAGPAGLMAALEVAKRGGSVSVLDENLKPGGQLFKQIHKFFGSEEHHAKKRGTDIGKDLLEEGERNGVEILLNSTVIGIFENNVLLFKRGSRLDEIQGEKVVIATGASENPFVFPGWTLPGVMGAGAAQTLMNLRGVVPGKKILMVGSGNIGLIVSYQLTQAGATVVAVVEASAKIGGYGVHASKIRRAGIPIYVSHTIREAIGKENVESAVIVRLDNSWRPLPKTEKILDVDTICLAVGLSPSTELTRLAGCKFIHLPELGGHVPIHDQNMETTVPGIFVAGDAAGTGEASTAMEEGRLAGIGVSEHLGYLSQSEALALKKDGLRKLSVIRMGPFGKPHQIAKQKIYEVFDQWR